MRKYDTTFIIRQRIYTTYLTCHEKHTFNTHMKHHVITIKFLNFLLLCRYFLFSWFVFCLQWGTLRYHMYLYKSFINAKSVDSQHYIMVCVSSSCLFLTVEVFTSSSDRDWHQLKLSAAMQIKVGSKGKEINKTKKFSLLGKIQNQVPTVWKASITTTRL